MHRLPFAAALLAALALAAPASAAKLTVPKPTTLAAPGPGPAATDQVAVYKFGPASAKRVLVLVPGTNGSAGNFIPVANDLVQRVPGLAVWAYQRREHYLEDATGFAAGNPDTAFGYYFKLQAINGKRFDLGLASKALYGSEWGLKTQIADLHRVVQLARNGGKRKVILGGHSLGASQAVAYASWDFNGRPGVKDLVGLVLIDGGGGAKAATAKERADLAKREAGLPAAIEAAKTKPYLDLLQTGLPWATGVFAELGALYAIKAPNGLSPVQSFALLPAALKPAFPVTNEAEFGFAFDAKTSPAALALIHATVGRIAPTGDPRGWIDDGLTPVQRLAQAFGNQPMNGAEWYFPVRLSTDLGAVAIAAAKGVTRTALTNQLGLRAWDRAKIDVPLLAYQTSLSQGGVLRSAKDLKANSKIPRAVYVNDPKASHLDPLAASPAKSKFLKAAVPFLKSLK